MSFWLCWAGFVCLMCGYSGAIGSAVVDAGGDVDGTGAIEERNTRWGSQRRR